MILIYILRQFLISMLVVLIFYGISNLFVESSNSNNFYGIFINAGFLTLFVTAFKYFNYRATGLKFDASDLSFTIIPEYKMKIISKLDNVELLNRLKNDYKFIESVVYSYQNTIVIDLKEDIWRTEKIEIQFQTIQDGSTEYWLKSKSRYLNLFGDFGQNKNNVNYLKKLIKT